MNELGRQLRIAARSFAVTATVAVLVLLGSAAAARGQGAPQGPRERLCDTAFEDCRGALMNFIVQESTGIDVSFWLMNDTDYADLLIRKHGEGVPVRVIIDARAAFNKADPNIQVVLDRLAAAGIPMLKKKDGGNLHWKMMLFAGQNVVQFSGANYSFINLKPFSPYSHYNDEIVYFSDDPAVVDSFKTKFDDNWTDDARFVPYAGVAGARARRYPVAAVDPELNFQRILPTSVEASYPVRLNPLLQQETQGIDVVMFRITNSGLADRLIDAKTRRGVPVRLITEPDDYRNPLRGPHSYNVDRMYMAGISVMSRVHQGQNHEKLVLLYGQGLSVFGSSNWGGASQDEHDYFTKKGWAFSWLVNHFNRKWLNQNPLGVVEYAPFVPLPPDAPVPAGPADEALGQSTTVTVQWQGGPYAHKFDVLLGTDPANLQPVVSDAIYPNADIRHFPAGSPLLTSGSSAGTTLETYQLPGLAAATTYYWRVVAETMAGKTAAGPVWSFTTAGDFPPPNTPVNLTATGVAAPRSINIAWGDVGGETGYKLERSADGVDGWAQVAAVGADVLAYTDGSVVAGNTYHYRVRAYNASGFSPYSGVAHSNVPLPGISSGDIVLYASEAPVLAGAWQVVSDASAAGGAALWQPNAKVTLIGNARAAPAHYFELTFNAEAGRAYRLWIRGRAEANNGSNDSVHVQFSGSVDAGGAPLYRIGTTSSTVYNLQECTGCALSGWGWEDNGFGAGVMGPLIYFGAGGPQTIRVQAREDGLTIDQIVLSPDTYLNVAPGPPRNDNTILPKTQ